jgi:prolyl-tRNA synthetase
MYASKLFLPALKETPADAELISHKLMLRAGLIRKLASGLYTWLPLGLRVLRNVENIVREEMNNIDAQEMLMPAVQPAELWNETGRWEDFGPQLLKMQDRHKREFCFGPTHEEVITDLIRYELRSYKQLPCTFYQIQTKFRDEIRPRFGIMRAREFLMKDAYSFHLDEESLTDTYQDMYKAYSAICTRAGLKFRVVLADSGAIGGNRSQEFHVLADSGEDEIAYCPNSDYAANIETATSAAVNTPANKPSKDIQKISTPNIHTVAEQAKFMKLSEQQIVKTLIVEGQDTPAVALLLRGDHDLNIVKAEKHPLIKSPLTMVSEAKLKEICGCRAGFCGPKDLNIPIIADNYVISLSDFSCGANEDDMHFTGVNWDKDIPTPTDIFDLHTVKAGDLSPDGKGKLEICRGIEVGHIFQLGDKYSQAMKATVLDDKGKQRFVQMGCYGIGVSRIVAASIEQSHDDKGIIWPLALAPFQIVIVPMQYKKYPRVQETANKIYEDLTNAGFEVLLDDRNERPGVMFATSDLIGIPHRLVVGEKGIDNNQVEYKAREKEDVEMLSLDNILEFFLKSN